MDIPLHPTSASAMTAPLRDAVPIRRLRSPGLAAALRALAAGLAASADLRRLSRMTDEQLASHGLTRSDLPKELFDRHFTA